MSIRMSLLILLICIECVIGIVNINKKKKEKIDNFVNSLLFDCDRHSNVVGMNLAIVYEGEILYTTGYGVKNLGRFISIYRLLITFRFLFYFKDKLLNKPHVHFSNSSIHYSTVCSGGSRISQTVGGGCQSQRGTPTYYLINFSRKLHENKDILAQRGGGVHPWPPSLDPPLV